MNTIGNLLLILVIVVLGSVCVSLTISYVQLLEKYEWALEIARMGLEERKEVSMKIREQILI